MDDHTSAADPWLALSLALPKAAQICHTLRENTPNPITLGSLIKNQLKDSPTSGELSDTKPLSAEMLVAIRSLKNTQAVCRALKWQNTSPDYHLLGLDHTEYPHLLQNTAYAPPLLYAKGSLSALYRPLLAVVGSRKASRATMEYTRKLCAELASLGIGIVSGLATGIDAAAHQGALEAKGLTIAVLATEPDRIYPARHKVLADQILSNGGLLLTEYGIGSITKPWHFPRRNRIISGVSLGVLVTEAALPSGSLTTARHAINQGREVMAVPGSVHNPNAKGCHELIKQGAALIETAEDVVLALGNPLQQQLLDFEAQATDTPESTGSASQVTNQQPDPRTQLDSKENLFHTLDEHENWLLTQLASQPAGIDELMTLTQKYSMSITISTLLTLLGRLELLGLISAEVNGRYARC